MACNYNDLLFFIGIGGETYSKSSAIVIFA